MLLWHYAVTFLELQEARVAVGNRAKAVTRSGEHGGLGLPALYAVPMVDAEAGLRASEREMEEALVLKMKQHPLAPFVLSVRGVGLPSSAQLLGITGPLGNFANPAKLWAYLGLDVKSDGRAGKRRKGVKMTPRAEGGEGAWSPAGRMVCYRIGEAFVKCLGSPYRDLYLTKKAEYLAGERTGPSSCLFGQVHFNKKGDKIVACGPAHPHAAARRYAVKRYLLDLWKAWRDTCPSAADETCGASGASGTAGAHPSGTL